MLTPCPQDIVGVKRVESIKRESLYVCHFPRGWISPLGFVIKNLLLNLMFVVLVESKSHVPACPICPRGPSIP